MICTLWADGLCDVFFTTETRSWWPWPCQASPTHWFKSSLSPASSFDLWADYQPLQGSLTSQSEPTEGASSRSNCVSFVHVLHHRPSVTAGGNQNQRPLHTRLWKWNPICLRQRGLELKDSFRETDLSTLSPVLHLLLHPPAAVFSFFSTHLPYFCSLLTPHPRSLPPSLTTSPVLPVSLLTLLFRPPPSSERQPLFLAVVCVCHVRASAISWSSGDSSRSPCPESCCGPTRGTGRAGAACWRQSPGPSCTADVGGSRRRGRTQPCCMSGTCWWFPSGGWCPRKAEAQPTWRGGSRNMTKRQWVRKGTKGLFLVSHTRVVFYLKASPEEQTTLSLEMVTFLILFNH